MCSLLNDYLSKEVSSDIKNVVIFSDSCGGQNRNHTICRYLCNLVERGLFEKITHYYPVRGHSFLPCDRDFGVVKRLLRKTDRIYTKEQYNELIVKSNNKNPFVCKTVDPSDIKNYKKWWPDFYKKNVYQWRPLVERFL